ncbi:hypothetical protein KIPB_007247 [Kipferlia bialata]|uniref:EF-hand domain-containing protein n=1 Tax=Kipferlia bialata TaxID=797122 RepID=A0A9K3GIW9_9EUKA|nr:hypothetical protein KIPB_007247 [Kipferlia bialata]|eukprot:g7247.t1
MNAEELQKAREVFDTFDPSNTGEVEMWRLRELLTALGQEPTDEELFALLAESDEDSLTWDNFVLMIKKRKELQRSGDDQDTVEAWEALGGRSDKSGRIRLVGLKDIVSSFGLNINLDAILRARIEQRLAGSLATQSKKKIVIPEELDYDEFRSLLTESRPVFDF